MIALDEGVRIIFVGLAFGVFLARRPCDFPQQQPFAVAFRSAGTSDQRLCARCLGGFGAAVAVTAATAGAALSTPGLRSSSIAHRCSLAVARLVAVASISAPLTPLHSSRTIAPYPRLHSLAASALSVSLVSPPRSSSRIHPNVGSDGLQEGHWRVSQTITEQARNGKTVIAGTLLWLSSSSPDCCLFLCGLFQRPQIQGRRLIGQADEKENRRGERRREGAGTGATQGVQAGARRCR